MSVAKSPESINKISFSPPGGDIVIVAATPGDSLAIALIAVPTKFNWVILFEVPTRFPSSNTDIEPGMIPPPLGTQNLSPGLSINPTTMYCCPVGILGSPKALGVSPRFGSASATDKYLYLSVLNCDCGVFLERPDIYFAIIN